MAKKKQDIKELIDRGYCRRCRKVLSINNFYEAINIDLDRNGKMSICINCCNKLYDEYFKKYGSMEYALYLTCKDLDIIFNKECMNQTKNHLANLEAKGKTPNKIFGYYKSKIGTTGKMASNLVSLRFGESDELVDNDGNKILIEGDSALKSPERSLFWGKNFDYEDILFLDNELESWKQTHKCDNRAELTLLKEICIKILEIRQEREMGRNVSSLQKELQELMKTASFDPAKANVASAGKSHECFGLWVKDIEQFRPAEWHDKQEKYKDMDGFIPYIKDYIVRPIKNFITGSRDFQINDNIDANLDSEEGYLDG